MRKYVEVDHTDKDALKPGEYFVVAAKRGKYRNKRVWANMDLWGVTFFPSKLEFTVACELEYQQEEGYIRDLKKQVDYEVAPKLLDVSYDCEMVVHDPIRYRADFEYFDYTFDATVIVDVKGRRDKLFDLKWHLLRGNHGLGKVFCLWYADRKELSFGGQWVWEAT